MSAPGKPVKSELCVARLGLAYRPHPVYTLRCAGGSFATVRFKLHINLVCMSAEQSIGRRE